MNDYGIPKTTLVDMCFAIVLFDDGTTVSDKERYHTEGQAKAFIETYRHLPNFKAASIHWEQLPVEGVQIY